MLGHVDFIRPPSGNACQFHIHVQITKRNCSRLSNERTEAEIMSNFLHLKIGLTWFHQKCKIWELLKCDRDKMAVILQTFSSAFSSFKVFAFLSIFRWTLFPWVQCVRKKKLLKICCRHILDSLEQNLWNVQVICIHFSQFYIFRCSFGCHSKGFLPLYHNGFGKRCNEGLNVLFSNLMYCQPIFLQNNCVLGICIFT